KKTDEQPLRHASAQTKVNTQAAVEFQAQEISTSFRSEVLTEIPNDKLNHLKALPSKTAASDGASSTEAMEQALLAEESVSSQKVQLFQVIDEQIHEEFMPDNQRMAFYDTVV